MLVAVRTHTSSQLIFCGRPRLASIYYFNLQYYNFCLYESFVSLSQAVVRRDFMITEVVCRNTALCLACCGQLSVYRKLGHMRT